MKFAVITFPGSNCDQDIFQVTNSVYNIETDMLWHNTKQDLSKYDCIFLPGGFSYGDYLRSGAIARFAPMMGEVVNYAEAGGLVVGICNGFQILLEAGLLAGAMKVNNSLKFICKTVELEIVNAETPFTNQTKKAEILRIPVAHQEGNYFIDKKGLAELKKNNQIVLRYKDEIENPNGSIDNIAGITNKAGNVFGLMPHPERAAEEILGNVDGKKIFDSIINFLQSRGGKIGA